MSPTFSTTALATSADIPRRRVLDWLSRRIIEFDPADSKSIRQGSSHQFSPRAVVRARLLGRLVSLGHTPARAALWVRAFTNQKGRLLLVGAPNGAVVVSHDGMQGLDDLLLELGKRLSANVPGYQAGQPFSILDISNDVAAVEAAAQITRDNNV
jgi:hypothetical protein